MQKFRVLNVKCEGCANSLKKKLEPIFGKIDVNLELEPREITIYQDEIDEDKLKNLLKSLGYPLVGEDMNFIDEVEAKTKSFISCAIGKATL